MTDSLWPESAYSETPLTTDLVLQISAAALHADEAVRAEAERAAESNLPGSQHVLDTVNQRAHEAHHQSIRDTCAELGVVPSDYFREDPAAAAVCVATCPVDWPEVSTAAVHLYPDEDTHLTLLVDLHNANVSWGARPPHSSSDGDWEQIHRSGLDEEPPASDLNSAMGSGY